MNYWTKWAKAAGVRALKTFGQAFASAITVGLALNEIDWVYVASCAVVAAVYSLATSLGGLPEVDGLDTKGEEDNV